MVAAPRAAAEPAWGSESAIETYLAGQMRDLRIVGLQVSIVRDGVVSFDRGFGSADGAGRLVDKHTVFSLGSVSKQFTGLAIQRLVATGKLDLDTTVHSIFPRFGTATDEHSKITVRQLLSQTSGFDTASGLAGWVVSRRQADLQSEVNRLAATSLGLAPGSGFQYSNSNYNLLGAIVEQISGKPFAQAMQDLVFAPAGLRETSAGPVPAETVGQYPWLGQWSLPTPGVETLTHAPSAFIRSTGHDLTTLLLSELDAKPGNDPNLLLPARAPLAQIDQYSHYASGWFVRQLWELTDRNEDWQRSDLPMAYSHEGSTNRTASEVLFSPDLGFGLAVLSNTAIGLDQSRWGVFIDGLIHTILGTQAAPMQPADLVLALAPFLLVGLPLLQAATLIWVGRTTRRPGRRRARIAGVLALVVHAAALFFVFRVAPTQDPTVPSLEFLWENFPDVGISSILSILLALLLAGHLTIRLAKARTRTPARHRVP